MRILKLILPVLFISLFMLNCSKREKMADFELYDLRVEYKTNPFVETTKPRFSWKIRSESLNQSQLFYQVIVASDSLKLNPIDADLWDSKKQLSPRNRQLVYNGKSIKARQKAYWKVRVWDADRNPSKWSETASFEVALLNNKWSGDWIGYDIAALGKGETYHMPPAPYLRKDFNISNEIKSARMYVTGLGLYEISINGKKVGSEYLAPGWTDYSKRLHYQAFDIKDYLQSGKNTIGSVMSYGWYAGYVGFALLNKLPKVKGFYGEVPKLYVQIEVDYVDGWKEFIKTDVSWKAAQGPIVETDILNGETYDATKELTGWDSPGYDDSNWEYVKKYDAPATKLELHPGMPIQIFDTLNPISINKHDDKYIFNLGQNFAGFAKLKVKGKAGQKITLRFAEMLNHNGSLMTENLRMARATDTYICKGDPNGETWMPKFTYHGFQFVEVSGLGYEPGKDAIIGYAITSNNANAGSFECSNEMINQLYSNIVWTQKANFIDIPTDCPQRDERLGWTGDAQVYVSSAILNCDVAAFFTKWMKDLNDAQFEEGAYPNFAPEAYQFAGLSYSPGWMEAGVICPYHIFKAYGDVQIVKNSWPNMSKYMDFMKAKAGDNAIFEEGTFADIVPKGGFGDWLSIGKKSPPDLIASMYYSYCAQLMAEMAAGIGEKEDAKQYAELAQKINSEIIAHYTTDDFRFTCNEEAYDDGAGYINGNRGFTGHTQTVYANAIYMNILKGEAFEKAGDYLVELIEEAGGKLTTGFLGVKPLLPALSATGHSETAYQLLLNTEYPSWGFEIKQGASTIWERWDSYTIDKGFQNPGMNSFSHYAFGSVYEWMVNNMAGIRNIGGAYNSIELSPEIDERISFAKATYESSNGQILSHWKKEDKGYKYLIEIPINTTAKVVIPAKEGIKKVKLNRKRLAKSKLAKAITELECGTVEFELGSGKYEITFE